jgi:hypothetical protein
MLTQHGTYRSSTQEAAGSPEPADVLGVGLLAQAVLDHLDSTDHKAARLCCKSVKAQVMFDEA